jgi:hypothetical protein
MAFYRGQKVVYVGPDFSCHPLVVDYKLIVPKPKAIYTIRGPAPRSDGMGYLLCEIVNREVPTIRDGFCEIAINASWLRPLVERKTDIGFAHEILRKATKRHGANV